MELKDAQFSCTFPAQLCKSLMLNGAGEGNRTLVIITKAHFQGNALNVAWVSAEIPLPGTIFLGGFRTGHHCLPLRAALQSSGSAGQNSDARSCDVGEFANREHYSLTDPWQITQA
jgi:hypothetical protein